MRIVKPRTCCGVFKNTLLPYTPSLTLYSSCSECILCCMAAYNSTTVSSREATTMPCVPIAGSCVTAVDHFFMVFLAS